MDGAVAALLYGLLLSITYKGIARALRDKLSSAECFALTYLVSIYTPIYISLAKILLPAILIPLSIHIFSAIVAVNSRDYRAFININIYASIALSIPQIIIRISWKP